MRTELEVQIYNIEKSRQFTKMYLSLLKKEDPLKSITVDGVELNSVYWMVGHLAWAQNTLGIRSSGGAIVRKKWLKYFGIGKQLADAPKEELPTYEAVYEAFKEVNDACLKHLKSLSEEVLEEENKIRFELFGENSVRMCISHVARHEATHAGQLALYCKVLGIKTA